MIDCTSVAKILRDFLLRSALFWDLTQCHVVILFWRFGTTYQSHPQKWRSIRRKGNFSFWTSWHLKLGMIHCPETSVKDYHSTLRKIPEERTSHQRRSGSLKSKILYCPLKLSMFASAEYAQVWQLWTITKRTREQCYAVPTFRNMRYCVHMLWSSSAPEAVRCSSSRMTVYTFSGFPQSLGLAVRCSNFRMTVYTFSGFPQSHGLAVRCSSFSGCVYTSLLWARYPHPPLHPLGVTR
jgi:hypothetical protein